TQNGNDNLPYQKKSPVLIQTFIDPGTMTRPQAANAPAAGANAPPAATPAPAGRIIRMRSVEYDTVTDRYARFLQEEILAEVGAKYNLRTDGYSHGIAGEASGALA